MLILPCTELAGVFEFISTAETIAGFLTFTRSLCSAAFFSNPRKRTNPSPPLSKALVPFYS
jgi:hypothetical protein